MQEIWKDIKNFEGCYQVSNFGNIRRLDTLIPFKGTLSIKKGKVLKTTKNSKGYLTIVLCWKSYRKTYSVHRLVALTFLPNVNNKPQINHIDGNPLNNKVDNLEWCTFSENQRHAYDTGLKGKNENSGMAKLTNLQVIEIKKILKIKPDTSLNKFYKQIADMFNVSRTTIKWIDQGKTWANITVED
jgi:hypothetical protein